MHEDNDGRFPDDSLVEVRYPRDLQEELGDRSGWPWLPGSILGQCGPDEWQQSPSGAKLHRPAAEVREAWDAAWQASRRADLDLAVQVDLPPAAA